MGSVVMGAAVVVGVVWRLGRVVVVMGRLLIPIGMSVVPFGISVNEKFVCVKGDNNNSHRDNFFWYSFLYQEEYL